MAETRLLERERTQARQVVERFTERFGPGHRLLACHAALPLILTPELLNYLRNRFLRSQVPWVAEADLLLSELCQVAGYEQFVMDQRVRAYLIEEMSTDPSLGPAHIAEVARLLITYIRHLARNAPTLSAREMQAQRWAAMVYLDDQQGTVVQEISDAFERCTRRSASGIQETERLDVKGELAWLVRITQALAPQLDQYPALVEHARTVGQQLSGVKEREAGIEVLDLTSLTQSMMPPWPAIATNLRQDMELVQQGLRQIIYYKRLHDLLLFLESQCQPMMIACGSLRNDPSAWDDLFIYLPEITQTINNLSDVVSQSSNPVEDNWIAGARQARDELASAIERLSPTDTQRALVRLDRITTREPARLNHQLVIAAKALPLHRITGNLQALHRLDLDSEAGKSVSRVTASLTQLGIQLEGLVHQHDRWQAVTIEVKLIQSRAEYDLDEVRLAWPHIRVQLTELCGDSVENWANSIRASIMRIDRAIAESDFLEAWPGLVRLDHSVRSRFFGIDHALLMLCEELYMNVSRIVL